MHGNGISKRGSLFESSDQKVSTKILNLSSAELSKMINGTCLEVFPEELWELIMDQMIDSRDIQNVFAAFPELSKPFHWKKTTWLFDQVFPHLRKQWYMAGTEDEYLPKCRLMCRRWSNVLDNYVENRGPYNSNGINRRTVNCGEFTYLDDTPCFHTLFGADVIGKMYNSDLGGPSQRNPFIGRRVILWNLYHDDSNDTFLDACVLFLAKYGHHIYHLDIYLADAPDEEGEMEIVKVLKCLTHTPNLRSLAMQFQNATKDVVQELKDCRFSNFLFPPLPHLHSLNISGVEIGSILSLKYDSEKLYRLGVPINCLRRDKFKYIRELTLDIGNMQEQELEDVPLNAFPLLGKLTIQGGEVQLNINNLFTQLAGSKIEELHIRGCRILENPSKILSPIPSIKYARIYDSLTHNFDFLKMLTSLSHLHLDCNFDHDWRGTSMDFVMSFCRNPTEFTAKVRTYIYQSFVPSSTIIWNDLPMLKLLSVGNDCVLKQFATEYGNKLFQVGDVD